MGRRRFLKVTQLLPIILILRHLWTLISFASFQTLQRGVPEQLDAVGGDIVLLRKYARKSWWYMNAYRQGLTGKPTEHAVKKYRSHRRVTEQALEAFS